MTTGKIHIGTSGFSYANWRGVIYEEKAKGADFLKQYSRTFDSCELNGCFYRLPTVKTVERWRDEVPDEFRFCPKMSRFLTHIKRLKEAEEPLDRFFSVFEPLYTKLGPVLIQLPATLKFDPALASDFFKNLRHYKQYKFAFEPRHESWFCGDSITLLEENNIAFVISDNGGHFAFTEFVTARDVYIRFHGPGKLFDSSYSEDALRRYAGLMLKWSKQGLTCWAFFNNTMNIAAIENALMLKHFVNGA